MLPVLYISSRLSVAIDNLEEAGTWAAVSQYSLTGVPLISLSPVDVQIYISQARVAVFLG